jgi:hypothetical protein
MDSWLVALAAFLAGLLAAWLFLGGFYAQDCAEFEFVDALMPVHYSQNETETIQFLFPPFDQSFDECMGYCHANSSRIAGWNGSRCACYRRL